MVQKINNLINIILAGVILILTNSCINKANNKNSGNIEQLFKTLSLNSLHQFKNDGLKLPPSFSLINEQGDSIDLKELSQTKFPLLLFWFDEFSCDQCILKVFEFISNNNVPDSIMLVISNHKSQRNLYIFKQTHKINYTIYRTTSEFGTTIENERIPFLFVLDKSYEIKNFFIPEKSYSKGINDYIVVMKSRYFDNEQSVMSSSVVRISFGNIKQNEDCIAKFVLSNIGNKPIFIHDVETTCGCTIPQWDSSPIKNGDSTYINIRYDTSKTGRFNKKIFVHSNASNSPLCLTIDGVVL
jgi:peroxiredoxin